MVLIRKMALRLGSVAVAMVLLFGLCACKGESGREDEKELAFSESTYTIERFTTLDVSVSGTESVAYSSSDESVFTVSAGKGFFRCFAAKKGYTLCTKK